MVDCSIDYCGCTALSEIYKTPSTEEDHSCIGYCLPSFIHQIVNITSSALKFSLISEYIVGSGTLINPKLLVSPVWSLDGNLAYGEYPHILLLLAGIVTLLILWLPYTLVLLFMQWLCKVSHLSFLNWMQQFFPISDAYFAPLKHEHQYWFGVLLLVRGILLVTSTSAFGIPYSINLLILLVFTVGLLFYMNLMQVYKSTGALLLDSSFVINLIGVSGYFMLTYSHSNWKNTQAIAVEISTGLAFLQFCGIVVYAVTTECWLHCKSHCVKAPESEADVDGYRPLIDINN